jgi:hypothetical protein
MQSYSPTNAGEFIRDLDVIVEALLSVHQQIGRRRNERTQQPALPEHAPAPQHDREWDF